MTEWYHGSPSAEPISQFERRDKGPDAGPRDWNTRLGSHWTSDHSVAEEFADGGTVHHASLSMASPRHYDDEWDLDHEAHAWARSAGHSGLETDQGILEGPGAMLDLRKHPHGDQIADGFKAHLESQGHDGITYGNRYEGEAGHRCAIAFHPQDVTVTSHHRAGEPCTTKKSGLTMLTFEEHYERHERAAGDGQGGQERRGLGEPRGGHRGASSRGLAREAADLRGDAPAPGGPGGLTPDPAAHAPRLREIADGVRQHERAGGQCGFVSEIAHKEFGWPSYSGFYHHPDGRVIGDHVWNVHEPSGTIIDATSDQHGEGHDVRFIRPDDPEHKRYQYAEDEDDYDRRFDEARTNREQHGNYWWTGGPNEHAKAYEDKVNQYRRPTKTAALSLPEGFTWHNKVEKDLRALDGRDRKQVMTTLNGIASSDPGTLAQTHPLTGVMKGWYATKVSRGHRIIHRPNDGGGIHVGYVGLHEYEKAIQRLTSRDHLVLRMRGITRHAGANGDLPEGLTFEHVRHPDHHELTARQDGWPLGYLQWHTGADGKTPGRIRQVRVKAEYRRQGIASALLAKAREIDPQVHHSDELSPDGEAWAQKRATAEPGYESYYHITDNPHFAPRADHVPHDNTFSMSERKKPGLYLTKDPNHWGTMYGYQRPYLAEVHVPKGTGGNERWGNEHFVEGKDLDKVKVHRVIPLDEHIRETYGEPGRIESFHGTTHDGRELESSGWGGKRFKEPLGEGYKYSGPDVRDMPASEHRKHYERWRDYAAGGGIEGYPFGHNEFDDKKMTFKSGDDESDYDDEGQFVMRDRHGNETGRKWASKMAGKNGDLPTGISYRHTSRVEQGNNEATHYMLATHPDADDAMLIDHAVGMLSWHEGTGKIIGAETHPDWQRRGIASEMLRRAREITPGLKHSNTLSPAGREWASKTAGKNGPDYTGLSFHLHDKDDEEHTLIATHPEHGPVGALSWGAPGNFMSDEILSVVVPKEHRRRGVARQMLHKVKTDVNDQLVHSESRSDAGEAWARSVDGEAPEVASGRMGEPENVGDFEKHYYDRMLKHSRPV